VMMVVIGGVGTVGGLVVERARLCSL